MLAVLFNFSQVFITGLIPFYNEIVAKVAPFLGTENFYLNKKILP